MLGFKILFLTPKLTILKIDKNKNNSYHVLKLTKILGFKKNGGKRYVYKAMFSFSKRQICYLL